MFLLGLLSAEALAVLAIAEHVQLVERRITCLVRNALGVHRCDEALSGDFRELLPIHMENVGVLAVTSAARVKYFSRDARGFTNRLNQATAIYRAPRCRLDDR